MPIRRSNPAGPRAKRLLLYESHHQAHPDRAPGLAVDMAYSPDGSRLYFLGRYSEDLEADAGDVFWVDAAAIEKMRP